MGWALAVLAATTLAEDRSKDDGIQRILRNGRDMKVSVEVPDSWATMERESKEGRCVLCLDGEIADKKLGEVYVQVFVHQLTQSAHPMQSLHLVALQRRADDPKAAVVNKPQPHVLSRYRSEGVDYVEFVTARLVNGQTYTVSVSTIVDAADLVRDEVFAIRDSLRSTLPPPVPLPPEFKTSEKYGVMWHVHPDVPARSLKTLQGRTRDVAKRFQKMHGKRKEPQPALRTNIVVVPNDDAARALVPNATMSNGCGRVGNTTWVLVRPLTKDQGRAEYDWAVTSTLFTYRYRSGEPHLTSQGEGFVAWSRIVTGEDLPIISAHLMDNLPSDLKDYVVLTREYYPTQRFDDPFRLSTAVWIAFFHNGPAKYRKLYLRYLERIERTGDFLGSLDVFHGSEKKMRAAMLKWDEEAPAREAIAASATPARRPPTAPYKCASTRTCVPESGIAPANCS